jgi:3-hydroxyethyl bacteriochlorophyllide a dehydrogenase
MQAEAVVFTQANTVEFRQVTCPDPGPNDAVIRTIYSWISNGTESSYLRGERIAGDTPYKPGDPTPFPLVPGYQKIGIVESVGSDITDLTIGETVFSVIGMVDDMFQPVGGHISPSVTPREHIWKLPPQPEPLAYSGLVLTQVGYNCGSRAPIAPGQTAVVIGDGMVGQWAAQTLKWQQADVIMLGKDDDRLDLAKNLVSCQTINVKSSNWKKELEKSAVGNIAVAIDVVGSSQMTEAMIPMMMRGGHIVSAGFCGSDDKISLQALRDLELSVDSVSSLTPERMNQTIELIADGDLKTLPLITHHFPANQVDQAWHLINNQTELVLGVILDW